jgi:hypothetical protein
MGISPPMKDITKLDPWRRGIFPSPFQPGDVFTSEIIDSETIAFRLVKSPEAPVVRPERINGRLMLPTRTPGEVIAAAIRAERDGR